MTICYTPKINAWRQMAPTKQRGTNSIDSVLHRLKSLGRRMDFLNGDDARKVYLSDEIDRCKKVIRRLIRRVDSDTPSRAWRDSVVWGGDEFPPGKSATLMIVSVVSGRYTPPQCLESEDVIDAMSAREAAWYSHPPSPSARAIQIHALYSRAAMSRLRND